MQEKTTETNFDLTKRTSNNFQYFVTNQSIVFQ